jgi:hypothetical protein
MCMLRKKLPVTNRDKFSEDSALKYLMYKSRCLEDVLEQFPRQWLRCWTRCKKKKWNSMSRGLLRTLSAAMAALLDTERRVFATVGPVCLFFYYCRGGRWMGVCVLGVPRIRNFCAWVCMRVLEWVGRWVGDEWVRWVNGCLCARGAEYSPLHSAICILV